MVAGQQEPHEDYVEVRVEAGNAAMSSGCSSGSSSSLLIPGKFADIVGNGTLGVGQHGRTHCRYALAGHHMNHCALGRLNRIGVVAVVLECGHHLDLTVDLAQTDVRRVSVQFASQLHRRVVPVAPGTQSPVLAVLVATVFRTVIALDLLFARLRNVGI